MPFVSMGMGVPPDLGATVWYFSNLSAVLGLVIHAVQGAPPTVWHALTPVLTFCKNYLVHVVVIATLTAISMLESVTRPKRATYYATLAVLRYVPALPSFAVYCHQALLSLGALEVVVDAIVFARYSIVGSAQITKKVVRRWAAAAGGEPVELRHIHDILHLYERKVQTMSRQTKRAQAGAKRLLKIGAVFAAFVIYALQHGMITPSMLAKNKRIVTTITSDGESSAAVIGGGNASVIDVDTAKFSAARLSRVVDGDTIRIFVSGWPPPALAGTGSRLPKDLPVRLRGIDAPERGRRARCAAEARWAEQSRDALSALLDGHTIFLRDVRMDKYNRLLANVRVNRRGKSIDAGAHLVTLNLAVPYDGGSRDSKGSHWGC
ncbi:TNase-like domain-containing protein [Pseudoscourfieldia marina]